jgi:DNA-binding response OmpR family regulator
LSALWPAANPSPLENPALCVLVAAGDQYALVSAAQTLEQSGYNVLRASDDAVATDIWRTRAPDVVLVDVELPENGGFALCRRIRQEARTPVIMLANDAVESDVIQGFASGADDFVVRPFGTKQLAWRIRAIHNRYMIVAPLAPPTNPTLGDLTLDLNQHELVRGARRSQLTPIEFRIFRDLATSEGSLVSLSHLCEIAWPNRSERSDSVGALKTHVAHLRRKLRDLGGHPRHINTISGQGYVLSATPKPP